MRLTIGCPVLSARPRDGGPKVFLRSSYRQIRHLPENASAPCMKEADYACEGNLLLSEGRLGRRPALAGPG